MICEKKKQIGGKMRYGYQREVNGRMEGVGGKSKKGAALCLQISDWSCNRHQEDGFAVFVVHSFISIIYV